MDEDAARRELYRLVRSGLKVAQWMSTRILADSPVASVCNDRAVIGASHLGGCPARFIRERHRDGIKAIVFEWYGDVQGADRVAA
eukprot:CAMPEP_0171612530 /NCGR_PEP_ID=MMETSP0990-20121206/11257_1 /TAXON_ID=483369 /ORGANISM="non described non described, Strain CCMP2098" /LENGTH=84 /DNA_ID=CAMNT_0012176263 /DNA_START=491 /DNA_END=745 /DNA_ORIENTATION=+